MPKRTVCLYGRAQIFLLPPSLRAWLPADLDLAPILTTYGGVTRGTVPSDPRMRVAVLLYAETRVCRRLGRSPAGCTRTSPSGSWQQLAHRISRPSVTSDHGILTRSWTYLCRCSCSVSGRAWSRWGHLALDGGKLTALGCMLLIPSDRQQRGRAGSAAARSGVPKGFSAADRMRRTLRTTRGRRLYAKRASTGDAGLLANQTGARVPGVLSRGHLTVHGEWALICTTHEVLTLWTPRRRRRGISGLQDVSGVYSGYYGTR